MARRTRWQRFLRMLGFRTEVSQPGVEPPVTEAPLWQRIHQDRWWYGASMHADNTPYGTPMKARKVWDDIVQIDPDAPMQYRPYWIARIGVYVGSALDAMCEEIAERTAAGYRVLFAFTHEVVTPQNLITACAEFSRRGCMPYGVGLWNEPEFNYTVEQLRTLLIDNKLAKTLTYLHDTYGVRVTAPGLRSFKSAAIEGYGAMYRDLFKDVPGFFLKIHSYGHMQPKHWVNYNFREEVRKAMSWPDLEIVVEETANDFVGEGVSEQSPGIADARGAEYLGVAIRAGCITQMPTCHFMLYHYWHHFNDISDNVHGMLRRRVATELFAEFRRTGEVGNESDLILVDPRGKEGTGIEDLLT